MGKVFSFLFGYARDAAVAYLLGTAVVTACLAAVLGWFEAVAWPLTLGLSLLAVGLAGVGVWRLARVKPPDDGKDRQRRWFRRTTTRDKYVTGEGKGYFDFRMNYETAKEHIVGVLGLITREQAKNVAALQRLVERVRAANNSPEAISRALVAGAQDIRKVAAGLEPHLEDLAVASDMLAESLVALRGHVGKEDLDALPRLRDEVSRHIANEEQRQEQLKSLHGFSLDFDMAADRFLEVIAKKTAAMRRVEQGCAEALAWLAGQHPGGGHAPPSPTT